VPGSLNHHVGEYYSEDSDDSSEDSDDSEELLEPEFDDENRDANETNYGDALLQAVQNPQASGFSPAVIIDETQAHIRHPPVKVPRHSNPFIGRPEQEQAFLAMLNHPDLQNEYVPSGFNLLEHEWDEGGYPTHQELKIGARRQTQLIELPIQLWLPRARRWARGVNIFYHFFDSLLA
jgi:hypothetical protein